MWLLVCFDNFFYMGIYIICGPLCQTETCSRRTITLGASQGLYRNITGMDSYWYWTMIMMNFVLSYMDAAIWTIWNEIGRSVPYEHFVMKQAELCHMNILEFNRLECAFKKIMNTVTWLYKETIKISKHIILFLSFVLLLALLNCNFQIAGFSTRRCPQMLMLWKILRHLLMTAWHLQPALALTLVFLPPRKSERKTPTSVKLSTSQLSEIVSQVLTAIHKQTSGQLPTSLTPVTNTNTVTSAPLDLGWPAIHTTVPNTEVSVATVSCTNVGAPSLTPPIAAHVTSTV